MAASAACHCSGSAGDAGTIRGHVCLGVYGTASAGAAATAQAADGTLVKTKTDDAGAFTLSGVPAGATRVIITNRVTQQVETLDLPAGGSLELGKPCTATSAALFVKVCVNGSNDPRPGVNLDLTYRDYGGAKVAAMSRSTDAAGIAAFPTLVPGHYRLTLAGLVDPVDLDLTPGSTIDYAASGCFDPSSVGGVAGRTCNPLDGTAAAGIIVDLQESDGTTLSTTSGDDGRYAFDGVPPGDHTLILRPPLQAAIEVPVTVSAGETAIIPNACTMGDSGSVAGILCDASSHAASPFVQLRFEIGALARYAATSASGYFKLADLPVGTGTLTVMWQSAAPTTYNVSVSADTETWATPNTCTITAFGTIVGRVCNPVDNSPVGGVPVELLLTSEPHPRTTTTATDGSYHFNLVLPGHHTLTIRPMIAAPVVLPVDVTANATTDLSPPACTAGPTGTATFTGKACIGISSSHPLPGATVTLTFTTGDKVGTAGLDGTFTFTALPAEAAHVTIARGSWKSEFDVTLPADVGQTHCAGPGTRVAIVVSPDRADPYRDNLEQAFTDLGLPVRRNELGVIVNAAGVVDLVNGRSLVNTGDPATTTWTDVFLANPANLTPYDMIFFASGLASDRLAKTGSDCPAFPPASFSTACASDPGAKGLANLDAYLDGGGAVYVSDWSYELIRLQFFQFINFGGNDFSGLADMPASLGADGWGAMCGAVPQTPTAKIMDENLGLILGGGTAPIRYADGFSYWTTVDSLTTQHNPYLKVFVMADVQTYGYTDGTNRRCSPSRAATIADSPLFVATPVGENDGILVFSDFQYLSAGGAKNAEIIRQVLMGL
jgi:hypothetical protein